MFPRFALSSTSVSVLAIVVAMHGPGEAFGRPLRLFTGSSPEPRVLDVSEDAQGVVVVRAQGTVQALTVADPAANTRVIVTLAQPALLSAGGPRALSALRSEQARFEVALSTRVPRFTLRRRFERCINAIALELPAREVEGLRVIPGVRAVDIDDTVRVALFQSVPLIGADAARTRFGVTGAGVRIGIIDTGIDYRHPSLGGGIGPGFKVTGGWDFVDDDADPMDLNGHGTHVAGIAAADFPGVRGVAPGATLVAYRVLDANGWGLDSDVIAAVERSTDPDGNPGTDDALDVINLSLAGPGGAEHPLSRAVDAASRAGVVVVAAAGNQGAPFGVGTPGAAREAITVAASSKSDELADFSSRGPAQDTWNLKPELTAPGVDILSCIPGGGLGSKSGTSMAAPHVAGAAALLLERNPHWTPPIVKGALVASARPLVSRPVAFGAGSGRLDVVGALTTPIVVIPAALDFGHASTRSPVWARAETLAVRNLSGRPQVIQARVPTDLPAGAVLSCAPSSVSIAPNGTASIVAKLTVNHDQVPWPPEGQAGFESMLRLSADSADAVVPVGFSKGLDVSATWNGRGAYVVLLRDGLIVEMLGGGWPRRLLSPGQYDLFALYDVFDPALTPELRWVTRDRLAFDRDTVFNFTSADAPHAVTFETIGPAGNPVATTTGTHTIASESGALEINWIGFDFDRAYMSDLGTQWRYEWTVMSEPAVSPVHVFHGATRDVRGHEVHRNDPSALRPYRIVVTGGDVPYEEMPCLRVGSRPGWWTMQCTDGPIRAPGSVWVRDVWELPPPPDPMLGVGIYTRHSGRAPLVTHMSASGGSTLLLMADRRMGPDGVLRSYDPFDLVGRVPYAETRGGTLQVGRQAPLWSGTVEPGQPFDLHADPLWGYFRPPLGDWMAPRPPAYRLYRQGTLVAEGVIGSPESWRPPGALPAGRYMLEVEAPGKPSGIPGARARVQLSFDSATAWFPWSFLRGHVLVGGAIADSVDLHRADEARVRIAVNSPVPVVQVGLRRPGRDWETLPVSYEGGAEARLPMDLDGAIDLRIVATDANRDTLAWLLEPALIARPARPIAIRLASATAGPGLVSLSWETTDADGLAAIVERRGADDGWETLVRTTVRGERVVVEDGDAPPARRVFYRLAIPRADGSVYSAEVPMDVPERPFFALSGVWPNPARGDLGVRLSLPDEGPATLELFDLRGRRRIVRPLEALGPGRHTVDLNSRDLEPGVYFLRLTHPSGQLSRRVVLLR